ncbi:MAG: hypothetical protein DRP09_13040 [Candidatus Thorarchaeota archaeon]|nr:MAG: hypothetical protein DRP09_13040 [Candidatus Thorarchaeota archaeon]
MYIQLAWAELKNLVASKNLLLQYVELETAYNVWTSEGNVIYRCRIDKDDPRNDDQIDFEDNYKDQCNKALIPRDQDGKPYARAETRPINCTTVFTGVGDSDSNIGDGKSLTWDFSNDDDLVTDGVPEGYKRKRIEFKFLDSVWIKDGTVFFFNAKKGSYADIYIVCPAGYYYYDNNGVPHLATEDTPIAHYVSRYPIQGDCPMGDELNSETCSSEIPNYYKFWLEITVPDSDTASNGAVVLEMYRRRTLVL